MTKFNPNVEENPLSFTDRSKGPGVDKSLGKLFSGVGDIFGSAVKAADETIKGKIDEELYRDTDNIYKEHGVYDKSTTRMAGNEDEANPAEIARSMQNLHRLGAARGQGMMKDSDFYGRLHSEVRRLRAKYPGHRDYIDRKVGAITGVNPANALYRSLMREWDAEASAKFKAQDDNWKFVDKHLDDVAVPPELLKDRTPENGARVRRYIEERLYEKTKAQMEHTRRKQKHEAGNFGEKDQEREARNEANRVFNEVFSFGHAAMGKVGYNDIRTMYRDALKDGVFSEEEKKNVALAFQELEGALHVSLNQALKAGTFNKLTNREAIIKDTVGRLDFFKEQVMKGNLSVVNWNVAAQRSQQAEAVISFLNRYPHMKRVLALREVLGSQAFQYALSLTKDGIDARNKIIETMKGYILADALGPQKISLKEAVKEMEKVAGPGGVRNLLSTFRSMINNPDSKVPDANRARLIKQMFSGDGEPLVKSFSLEDHSKAFSFLFNPKTIAEARRLGEADPTLWRKFKVSARRNWAAATHTELSTLKELFGGHGIKKDYSIQWNPEDRSFTIKSNQPDILGDDFNSSSSRAERKRRLEYLQGKADAFTDKLNLLLLTEDNPNDEKVLEELKRLGLDPDADNVKGVIDGLIGAVKSAGEALGRATGVSDFSKYGNKKPKEETKEKKEEAKPQRSEEEITREEAEVTKNTDFDDPKSTEKFLARMKTLQKERASVVSSVKNEGNSSTVTKASSKNESVVAKNTTKEKLEAQEGKSQKLLKEKAEKPKESRVDPPLPRKKPSPEELGKELEKSQRRLEAAKGKPKVVFAKKWQKTGMNPAVVSKIERASQALGRPLLITSGHRPVWYSKKKGLSLTSQHVGGKAADISMAGMNDSERRKLVEELAKAGFRRFITYTRSSNMLHVDTKIQRGANYGRYHAMHDKSMRNLSKAPKWFRDFFEEQRRQNKKRS